MCVLVEGFNPGGGGQRGIANYLGCAVRHLEVSQLVACPLLCTAHFSVPLPYPPFQDLYDSISAGDYPEWTLCIQVMDPADEEK